MFKEFKTCEKIKERDSLEELELKGYLKIKPKKSEHMEFEESKRFIENIFETMWAEEAAKGET